MSLSEKYRPVDASTSGASRLPIDWIPELRLPNTTAITSPSPQAATPMATAPARTRPGVVVARLPRPAEAAPGPRCGIGWVPGNIGKEHPDLTEGWCGGNALLGLTLPPAPDPARATAVRMPLRCC